ncbi:hypothetical protein ACFOSC_10670 [Streptantibioticus rubrisoli]|uniref:Uncharacterized protein n=1 Tax=Streptantibioticus rubrisoli TaxID=1387313 RepID=A0ABT1PEL6_9ACTN|nr:hypothetical protein [Streptantibioticus rubrisoli]MCQ4042765.1 hypothetical protein [Streptantibioticus rubrisoli]
MPGPSACRAVRRQAGQKFDEMPLPPQCAARHILGRMPQQRGRAQRGPLTGAEGRKRVPGPCPP